MNLIEKRFEIANRKSIVVMPQESEMHKQTPNLRLRKETLT